MKYVQAVLLGLSLILVLDGCGSSNPVVATVGNDKITLTDFEKNYAKNNGGWESGVSSSMSDREHFLDLLVKFRLKVKAAKDRGLLHDTSVTNELNSYRITVSQSYMLEKELIEPHVKELYQHRLEDIQASHILFRLPQKPTPADTLAAYEKAEKVIALIPTVPFDTLAKKYSEDPQTASHGGLIGWINTGRIPDAVENALYSMKAGECSKTPVRSSFGYHIFKVLKREPAKGSIRISHILKRFSPDLKDTAAVRDSIWQIYDELKHGANFADLARKYSDDPASASRGGDIGYYGRGNLRQDIGDLLYALPLDSVSKPYRQPYGYHIFEVTGQRPVPPYDQMEKELRTEYQQRGYQQDYLQYVLNLEHHYGVVIDTALVVKIGGLVDSAKTPSSAGWSDTLPSAMLSQTLFTCDSKPFTVKDFVEDCETSASLKEMPLKPNNVMVMVQRLAEAKALKDHAETAEQRYPQLKDLMNEYLDGILLYRIEQDEIWQKVVVNDSLLRAYYDTTKEKYRWPNRVNFAEIFVLNDSVKKVVEQKLAQGQDFLSVAEEYTARPGYREKLGIWGLQPYTVNELSQKASAMAVDSVSDFFRYQNGWSMLKVLAKDGAHVKTFEEAGPEVASAYQEQASKIREQEWLDALRQKYGVTIDDAVLSQAFKKKPVETN